MTSKIQHALLLSLLCLPFLTSSTGCHLGGRSVFHDDPCLDHYQLMATRVEYPDVQGCELPGDARQTRAPRTLDDTGPPEFWDLTWDEVVHVALAKSEVLRDLGVRVLTSPETAPTTYDPAITESDPIFGPEGALSAFDAQLATSLFASKNDRVFNNLIEGRGVNEFQQDLATFHTELSKIAATGTRFSLRNFTRYDANNATGNLFPSIWESHFEASARQPLLQGAGVEFNRIAGPQAQPGLLFTTGVVLARINTDVRLADFEAGVRDFLSELENAYWELYFAYRELDSQQRARDSALETWRLVQARFAQDLRGGEAFKEAQAREQYLLYQGEVQDALSGAPLRGRSVGVYRGERRLRALMGLPASQERLIRPADSPPEVRVHFEWEALLAEALTRRVELRRQTWQIKRRELELVAARNFTLPRLDAIGLYRFRGLGDHLTGGGPERFASAFKDLASGDHQEWEVGLQLQMPLGFRQAWSGVRRAELQLARERAILKEQELQISHGLSDAVSEASRAHAAVRTSFNRLAAAQQHLEATQAAFQADQVTVDWVLNAQERVADAQSRYYRALTDYALSLKDVHWQKGSLLEYHHVLLSEGSWPGQAYADARERAQRWRPKFIDYRHSQPGIISRGSRPPQVPREEAQGVEEDLSDLPPVIEELPPGRPAQD